MRDAGEDQRPHGGRPRTRAGRGAAGRRSSEVGRDTRESVSLSSRAPSRFLPIDRHTEVGRYEFSASTPLSCCPPPPPPHQTHTHTLVTGSSNTSSQLLRRPASTMRALPTPARRAAPAPSRQMSIESSLASESAGVYPPALREEESPGVAHAKPPTPAPAAAPAPSPAPIPTPMPVGMAVGSPPSATASMESLSACVAQGWGSGWRLGARAGARVRMIGLGSG